MMTVPMPSARSSPAPTPGQTGSMTGARPISIFPFSDPALPSALITQMYFEGDPLIWRCPIVGTIPDRSAIERLIAPLDMNNTIPMDARAYRFDIVLRAAGQRCSKTGWRATDMTQNLAYLKETASQTAGPYVHIGLNTQSGGHHRVYREDLGSRMVGPNAKGERITVTGRIIDGGGNVLKDAMIEIWQAACKRPLQFA